MKGIPNSLQKHLKDCVGHNQKNKIMKRINNKVVLLIQQIFQIILIPEKNGQIVNLSEKLEINLIVAHAGLLEQLKLCLIEFALLRIKQTKQEYLLIIYFLVVIIVEMDVKEVIFFQLGYTMKILGLSQEINIMTLKDVKVTHFPHVHIIPIPMNIPHVKVWIM